MDFGHKIDIIHTILNSMCLNRIPPEGVVCCEGGCGVGVGPGDEGVVEGDGAQCDLCICV